MRFVYLALILALSSSSAFCADDALLQAHMSKSVTCQACHTETPPAKRVKTAKCQECHGNYEALAARTAKMTPNNVHANHLGDLDCRECHGVHKQQTLACAECHQFKVEMPK